MKYTFLLLLLIFNFTHADLFELASRAQLDYSPETNNYFRFNVSAIDTLSSDFSIEASGFLFNLAVIENRGNYDISMDFLHFMLAFTFGYAGGDKPFLSIYLPYLIPNSRVNYHLTENMTLFVGNSMNMFLLSDDWNIVYEPKGGINLEFGSWGVTAAAKKRFDRLYYDDEDITYEIGLFYTISGSKDP